ncbi:hypothetical protein COLU111180_06295 [Cohnella lubricantis]|uniref:Helix-turn-helix domain-containing protein n=1 Tax=Cohnella lubricantis TaxID=2163172 RepID=A0A841TGC4_9BACL|nr:hypothetical protein [Cohnella lubricantis]MBB6677511.1 hypothetical protein [Cohnella lubricantis]MBP2116603.1 DNA invertase Pin-like site-specific DNA recombinase [Cohnella lubricantis]
MSWPASKYSHITPDKLRELRSSGKTIDEIAQHFNAPQGTIGWMLRKYGIVEGLGKGKYKRKPKAMHSTPTGREPGTEPMRVEITPEQEATIRALYRKVPRREIAKQLGIGKVLLNQMILQLGVGK